MRCSSSKMYGQGQGALYRCCECEDEFFLYPDDEATDVCPNEFCEGELEVIQ